jgi:hypothetical protein
MTGDHYEREDASRAWLKTGVGGKRDDEDDGEKEDKPRP